MPNLFKITVSLGELLDRLTIAELKCEAMSGEALEYVLLEHQALLEAMGSAADAVEPQMLEELRAVNQELWNVEDQIREHDSRADFGVHFVMLAQQVYRLNDRRHAIKRAISEAGGSSLIEQKLYRGCEGRSIYQD